jgi:Pleckstrin homology domain
MANIDSKMTRNQFIKNTMPTIRRVVADAAPNAFQESQMSLQPPNRPPPAVPTDATSLEPPKATNTQRPLLVHRPSYQSDCETANSGPATPVDGSEPAEGCGPLVTLPFAGKQAAWELQVEVVLKNFYNAIRQERLFLFGSDLARPSARAQPSSNSLSAIGGTPLRRSNSMVSKAGSENVAFKGRPVDGRLGMGSRWSSKMRSRTQLYPPSSSHAQSSRASRTSIDDDGASAISPSATSMWSRVSFGKTQASMSVNSFSAIPSADFHQSIGFANALSQAIIREEATGDSEESLRVRPLLEDESLELAGAPWAKEGIVKHKHHLESVDKKSRDRSWVECFAVIEKGWMRLFQFNANARSLRQKTRGKPQAGAVVGGGNWTENAEPLGSYLLRQSIATALPPPGYSKTRPHVWALSLPSGAVHLFQVGTPEIVKEFVSTANYWSARMSKEPLVGAVSNIEYGWSDAVINMALIQLDTPSRPSGVSGQRPSIQSSIRGSIDQSNNARPRLPADRININDWSPPMQSTMPSQLMEVDQLRALEAYVSNIEQELKQHNELQRPVQLAYTPRTANYIKAMNNWERKSSYLLQEIVKFTTYIESLRMAQTQQEKISAEREEREQQKDRAADEEKQAGMEEIEASAG